MFNINREPSHDLVEKLLHENQLPTQDISRIDMGHFFGCGSAKEMHAVVGLEVHGEDGLLRSLVVSKSARNAGYATALVEHLEAHARSIGINHLYLLTETAEAYFKNKGYLKITRDMASEPIKGTKQFSELCPASAVVMRKNIAS